MQMETAGEPGRQAIKEIEDSGIKLATIEDIKKIIKDGADVNFPVLNHAAGTPLGVSVYMGNAKLAALLLENGADPKQGEPLRYLAWGGGTPAVLEGKIETLGLLLEHGLKRDDVKQILDRIIDGLEGYVKQGDKMEPDAYQYSNVALADGLVELGMGISKTQQVTLNKAKVLLADQLAESLGKLRSEAPKIGETLPLEELKNVVHHLEGATDWVDLTSKNRELLDQASLAIKTWDAPSSEITDPQINSGEKIEKSIPGR